MALARRALGVTEVLDFVPKSGQKLLPRCLHSEMRLNAVVDVAYVSATRAVASLSGFERADMLDLFLAHYDGTDAEQFFADLDEKREVLLVSLGTEIVGFTTIDVYERDWESRRIRIIFSGDTVVHRSHWGQQALAFGWIRRLAEISREKSAVPLYWFLIVKGHRTYKFLPTFAKSFYPHWSQDRTDLKPLADALAADRFGEYYNPARGIVEFPESRGHLKSDLVRPTAAEMSRDAVQFFQRLNPDYERGCELVCLCEITVDNMRPLTRRLFGAT